VELELKSFIQKTEFQLQALKDKDREYDKGIYNHKNSLNSAYEELNNSIKALRDQKELSIQNKQKNIQQNIADIASFKQDIQNTNYQIDDLDNRLQRDKKHIELEFEDEKQRIKNNILDYQSMIYSKSGSFKEFLNEEVDGWERELFPVLDTKLLDMDIDVLKPKLQNADGIFGIKLDTGTLKKILTKNEAEEKISQLNEKLNVATQAYTNEIEKLDLAHKTAIDDLKLKIQLKSKDIELKEAEIEKFNKDINEIELHFINKSKELEMSYEKIEQQYKNLIKQIENERVKTLEDIELLNKSISNEKSIVKQKLQELNKHFTCELEKSKNDLEIWLKMSKQRLMKR